MPNKILIKNKKGFTIIEALVAITILMISIAGPLTVANKGLAASNLSRDQVIATYLAQDAIEKIKNIKDSDFKVSSNNWAMNISPYSDGSWYGIDTINYNIQSNLANSPLLLTPKGQYTYNNVTGSIQSPFSRKFKTTKIGNEEYRLEVVVSWKNGNVSNSITTEAELFKLFK